jgi:ribosomal protein L37AE/L43A
MDIPTDTDDERDGPHEYTWKTLLCECETSEEARQLCEALQEAGIKGWIEGTGTYSPYAQFDLANPRVLVAADQFDQARAITARPIPREIVEESAMEALDFEPPKCPKCGAADPVLEGVDPENTWRCEQCGEQWTESATGADEAVSKMGQTPP